MVIFLLLFVFIIPFPVLSQSNSSSYQSDEVLVLLPTSKAMDAIQHQPNVVRLYHRFPEFYVAGLSRQTLNEYSRSEKNIQILDERPWSASYAVSTKLGVQSLERTYRGFDVTVLFKSEEFDILSGNENIFQRLRQAKYSLVEIEPVPLTFNPLPEVSMMRDNPHPSDPISTIIAKIADSSIRSYIQQMQDFGTRYCTNANRDSVFRWLRNRYLETGITDVAYDSFQYSSTWQKNIIATIPGTVNPSLEIIIGGHLDSYSSNLNQAPGADDNASGTVAALEMARVLKAINYQPSMTLRFCGFAAEEAGLKGSAAYALKAKQANRNIKAMLNYDMIGNRTQSQSDYNVYHVWYPGAEDLSDLHASMEAAYTLLTPVLTTSYRSSSDSWSFYQQGYKSLFCIEHDFSPYYHSPNDLLTNLDIPYAAQIIKAGLATLLTIDQIPSTVPNVEVIDIGNGTSLLVQWESVGDKDVQSYKIYLGRTPGVYDTSFTQTGLTRTMSGLTNGTRYYIGVTAVDIAGQEGSFVEQSGTPLLIPLAPENLTRTNLPNMVRLNWKKNSEYDLRGYNIYRSSESNPTFTKLNGTPIADSFWNDTNLSWDIYRYYVTAQDLAGNQSSGSDTITGIPVDLQSCVMLRVSDQGGSSDTVWFGMKAGASDGIDTLFGETELPPPDDYRCDARWRIAGTNGTSLDIRDTLSEGQTTRTFLLDVQPGISGYPMTVRWNPSSLPTGDFLLLDEQTHGSLIRVNMKAESLLVLPNQAFSSLEILYTVAATMVMHVQEKWNLVSLPLEAVDCRKSILFPTAISSAYEYSTTNGYVLKETLQTCTGYWLKFPNEETIPLLGVECTAETIHVQEGWNLIGSISETVATSSVISNPPLMLTTPFFGYGNEYFVSENIESGKGYWVKVNQDGELIISSAMSNQSQPHRREVR
ncbi:MAG: M20/M25/M40 family metallo-hydrolase [Ignavibacteriae bacterium]|nr:M20/M25/M40 family metallo-hydrolase [Ignavibacteriota bacterium]